MNEFGGQQPQFRPQPKPQIASAPPPSSRRSPRPESPLAFADYIEITMPQAPPEPQPRTRRKEESPAIVISPPSVKETKYLEAKVEEDKHGGGCCKCVIM